MTTLPLKVEYSLFGVSLFSGSNIGISVEMSLSRCMDDLGYERTRSGVEANTVIVLLLLTF